MIELESDNVFLQERDEEGILYSYNIALQMQNEAIKSGFSVNKSQDMFILGLLHDIGKYYCVDGESVYKLSGKILRNNGYEYWKEVFSCMSPSEYQSEELRLLNRVLLLAGDKK